VQTLAASSSSDPDQIFLQQPSAVVADAAGNFYIADQSRHQIFQLTPEGELTLWAGSGVAGWQDGDADQAQFNRPSGLAFDSAGNLLVADRDNHRIRLITPQGQVSTWAGAEAGFRDGPRSVARFQQPTALVVAAEDLVYVADSGNHRIRSINAAGEVATVAGSGQVGSEDGLANQARLHTPVGLALDAANHLWIADAGNHRIRQLTPAGRLITMAGKELGFADGDLDEALFNSPTGLTLNAEGHLLVADLGNHRIRQLIPEESVTTLAGTEEAGQRDGLANQAQFDQPISLWVQPNGTIVVADVDGTQLRQLVRQPLESSRSRLENNKAELP
jgi:DNA-binding beta-propeller fold protein YncE